MWLGIVNPVGTGGRPPAHMGWSVNRERERQRNRERDRERERERERVRERERDLQWKIKFKYPKHPSRYCETSHTPRLRCGPLFTYVLKTVYITYKQQHTPLPGIAIYLHTRRERM